MIVLNCESGKFRIGPRVLRAPNTRLLRWVGHLWDTGESLAMGAVVLCVFVPLFSLMPLLSGLDLVHDVQAASVLKLVGGYLLVLLGSSLIFTSWVLFPLSVAWLVKSSDRYAVHRGESAMTYLSRIYDDWAALPTRELRRSTRPLLEQARVAAQACLLDSSCDDGALRSRSDAMRSLLTQSQKTQVKRLPLGDDDVQAVVALTNALRELDELDEPRPALSAEQVERTVRSASERPRLADSVTRRRL